LYKWLLANYAKPGDKILDTHVGSASSLIACHRMGFEYIGFEIDKDYWKSATERLEAEKAQTRLF
jgi:site-specific DNA-methyltransferase (adenine-specific)